MARSSLLAYPAERIAILKPSALGDIVHALPVLTALRQRYPHAHIAWVVNQSLAPVLEGHPALDELIRLDRQSFRGWWSGTRQSLRFARQLRAGRFDLVIDLQGLLRTGLMAAATGAARRVGLQGAREGSSWFYTDHVSVPGMMHHAVDRLWHMAQAFGVGDVAKDFTIRIDPVASEWVESTFRDCPRPWVAVAAGARWRTKRWPPESFANLIDRAQAHFGGTAILVGTPDEQPIGERITSLVTGNIRDAIGRTTLAQMIALLGSADLLLGNDTGPLHVGTALGRTVIAPYTCTKVALHGPYGNGAGAVESKVWCQGSYLKRCDRLECFDELQPDRLWPHLHEGLSAWSRQCRSA